MLHSGNWRGGVVSRWSFVKIFCICGYLYSILRFEITSPFLIKNWGFGCENTPIEKAVTEQDLGSPNNAASQFGLDWTMEYPTRDIETTYTRSVHPVRHY